MEGETFTSAGLFSSSFPSTQAASEQDGPLGSSGVPRAVSGGGGGGDGGSSGNLDDVDGGDDHGHGHGDQHHSQRAGGSSALASGAGNPDGGDQRGVSRGGSDGAQQSRDGSPTHGSDAGSTQQQQQQQHQQQNKQQNKGVNGTVDDPRIQWMCRVGSATFPPRKRGGRDRMQRLVENDEQRRSLASLLDSPDVRRVFVYEESVGKRRSELVCGFAPPAQLRGGNKAAYFVKAARVQRVSVSNVSEDLLFGEYGPDTLQHIAHLARDVFIPLLSHPGSQEGWHGSMSSDVLESVHRFAGNVTVTIGHTQGKTLLPLPVMDQPTPERYARDKEKLHMLESAVVTWTRQIRSVLRADAEQVFKDGEDPGPLAGLDFWADRAANLASIHEQLQGDRIRKVTKVLDLTKNNYYPAFNRLCKEVQQARAEAADVTLYLETLRPAFAALASADVDAIDDLIPTFHPMMFQILLVWRHSRYHNTPPRLVLLLRLICNELVRQATRSVDSSTLLRIDALEAAEKLRAALRVCGAFKTAYFDYKARATQECPANPWRIQNSAIFMRLDQFLERCHDILDLTVTVSQFGTLERIEIGGTSGRSLTTSVRQIYTDFSSALRQFHSVPYDVMDMSAKSFDDDFYEFRSATKELERRLGAVLERALDGCTTVTSAFKLLDSFEGLLERDMIGQNLEHTYEAMLAWYRADLQRVHELFLQHRDSPPIFDNLSPIAGAITWARALADRISGPMAKFRALPRTVADAEEAREVAKTHGSIAAALQDYEAELYASWTAEIDTKAQEKLKQPLLRRDPRDARRLHVNFDPSLVRLLREVKYLEQLGLHVPAEAHAVSKKAETFRTQVGNLELIVNRHNEMHATMLDVERPLLAAHLDAVDVALEKGLGSLNWKSHGIPEFIAVAMAAVRQAGHVLSTLKSGVADLERCVESWSAKRLFDRQEGRTYAIEDFVQAQESLAAHRAQEITEQGQELHAMLQASNRACQLSRSAPAWRAYVAHVNKLLITGMQDAVQGTLNYMRDQIDPSAGSPYDNPLSMSASGPDILGADAAGENGGAGGNGANSNLSSSLGSTRGHPISGSGALLTSPKASSKPTVVPLIEVRLELVVPDVQFVPDLDGSGGKHGIRSYASGWIDRFFEIGKLFKRLDGASGDYVADVRGHSEVALSIQTINRLIRENEAACEEERARVLKFSYLWTEDPAAEFAKFLDRHGASRSPGLSEEQIEAEREEQLRAEAAGQPGPTPRAPKPLPESLLEAFDERITELRQVQDEISSLANLTPVGWLRVDAKPAKQALSTWCSKWIFAFTHYLAGHVSALLQQAESLVDRADAGLRPIVDAGEDGLDALLERLGGKKGVNNNGGKKNGGGGGDASTTAAGGADGDGAATSKIGAAGSSSSSSTVDPVLSALAHARDVDALSPHVAAMFPPLRETVDLLARHGSSLPGPTHERLSSLPQRWERVAKLSARAQELLARRREAGRRGARGECETFAGEVSAARSMVEREAPWEVPGAREREGPAASLPASVEDGCKAHWTIAGLHESLSRVEARARRLETLMELLSPPSSSTEAGAAAAGGGGGGGAGATGGSSSAAAAAAAAGNASGDGAAFPTRFTALAETRADLLRLRAVWDLCVAVGSTFAAWRATVWTDLDCEEWHVETGHWLRQALALQQHAPGVKAWPVYNTLLDAIKEMRQTLPLVKELSEATMRERHWKQLFRATGVHLSLDGTLWTLNDLITLRLAAHQDEVLGILDRASKELSIERMLAKIDATWTSMSLQLDTMRVSGSGAGHHPSAADTKQQQQQQQQAKRGQSSQANANSNGSGVGGAGGGHEREALVLGPIEEILDTLGDNQLALQKVHSGKYFGNFADEVTGWLGRLGAVESTLTLWWGVQQLWVSLVNLFTGSSDIRTQLPEDASLFDLADEEWDRVMAACARNANTLEACSARQLPDKLSHIRELLERCHRSLTGFLEVKRRAFPRFYFVSSADLLEILSAGADPGLVARKYARKLLDGVADVDFDTRGQHRSHVALSLRAPCGETLPLEKPHPCTGQVESWLSGLIKYSKDAVMWNLGLALQGLGEGTAIAREDWATMHPGQCVQVAAQIEWAREVEEAMRRAAAGSAGALQQQIALQQERIEALIARVRGELSATDRIKLASLVTLDVHARDVVHELASAGVDDPSDFEWQRRLRYRWDPNERRCVVTMANVALPYGGEYIGNSRRLVVTPLTDRCYMTIMLAISLFKGAAPSGPAGTGKTETTKDLGHAVGLPVYVFNMSGQMGYETMTAIMRGMAATGSWVCFDEFNRLPLEVLSVVSEQLRAVLEAQRAGIDHVALDGVETAVVPSGACFATMNPGYAGRVELPESAKVLFRPVSMVVPDLANICEIMLFSEGFTSARSLAAKFIALHRYCDELMSRQRHYDWGLRAVRAVLTVAGAMKRAEPDADEASIIKRALRDFNAPKVVREDLPVLAGLIESLFPGVPAPRTQDRRLRRAVMSACFEQGLLPDDRFSRGVAELSDLLAVRHSVFIIGRPGSGKTATREILAAAMNGIGRPVVETRLNPKAMSAQQLYGWVSPATGEWCDGVLSRTMRSYSERSAAAKLAAANSASSATAAAKSSASASTTTTTTTTAAAPSADESQWIVLDGDIDPDWIESLNSVMDDNKVLTLSSNERITLADSMRLLFEISDLEHATPATVSRAGILHLDTDEWNWTAYFDTWCMLQGSPGNPLGARSDSGVYSDPESITETLRALGAAYLSDCLAFAASELTEEQAVPRSELNIVQSVARAMEVALAALADRARERERAGADGIGAVHDADDDDETAAGRSGEIGAVGSGAGAGVGGGGGNLNGADAGGMADHAAGVGSEDDPMLDLDGIDLAAGGRALNPAGGAPAGARRDATASSDADSYTSYSSESEDERAHPGQQVAGHHEAPQHQVQANPGQQQQRRKNGGGGGGPNSRSASEFGSRAPSRSTGGHGPTRPVSAAAPAGAKRGTVPFDRVSCERLFAMAVIWGVGGALMQDTVADGMASFSRFWRKTFSPSRGQQQSASQQTSQQQSGGHQHRRRHDHHHQHHHGESHHHNDGPEYLQIPPDGLVFDYYYDIDRARCVHVLEETNADYDDLPFVPTLETMRVHRLAEQLVNLGHPVLLCGPGGSGKTMVARDLLRRSPEDVLHVTVNLCGTTTPTSLQAQLDARLERKAGSTYGPAGARALTYFVDDLNVPARDNFGTQRTSEVLRQLIDAGMTFDHDKLSLRSVADVRMLTAMDPKAAGARAVSGRLMRHFVPLCISHPAGESLEAIAARDIRSHFAYFEPSVQESIDALVSATCDLHRLAQRITATVTAPTSRHVAALVRGLALSRPDSFPSATSVARLWAHEAYRVYGDGIMQHGFSVHGAASAGAGAGGRNAGAATAAAAAMLGAMADGAQDEGQMRFRDLVQEVTRRWFPSVNQDTVHAEPLILTTFQGLNAFHGRKARARVAPSSQQQQQQQQQKQGGGALSSGDNQGADHSTDGINNSGNNNSNNSNNNDDVSGDAGGGGVGGDDHGGDGAGVGGSNAVNDGHLHGGGIGHHGAASMLSGHGSNGVSGSGPGTVAGHAAGGHGTSGGGGGGGGGGGAAADGDEQGKSYVLVRDYDSLHAYLSHQLNSHNETLPRMDLVLFNEAIEHVCRIARILDCPGLGNALLIGVGGSGKQSLTRLAAYCADLPVVVPSDAADYGPAKFREDLAQAMLRAGGKGQGLVLMLTDAQITDESMLEALNDLLYSGDVPGLFTAEDAAEIHGLVRGAVKQAGLLDSAENCWAHFVSQVRANLHLVLGFSPAHPRFAARVKAFPALFKCTSIDNFRPWPRTALMSVAQQHLADVPLGDDETRESIVSHLAHVHQSAGEACVISLRTEGKISYTTPKSFLELIALFRRWLSHGRERHRAKARRLEVGLEKMAEAQRAVDDMGELLVRESALVEEKRSSAETLLAQVGQDQAVVEEQRALAAVEEEKLRVANEEADRRRGEVQAEYEAAEPALSAAREALNVLSKQNLTELKSFTKPPQDVTDVTAALLILLHSGTAKNMPDTSWAAAKKLMANTDRFLSLLTNFDKDSIPAETAAALAEHTSKPSFSPDAMRSKSFAAASLCEWVVSMQRYHEVFSRVEPRRLELIELEEQCAAGTARLEQIRGKVAALEGRLGSLTEAFESAAGDRQRVAQEQQRLRDRMALSERLLSGLSAERGRWEEELRGATEAGRCVVGDALVAAACVAYAGAFSRAVRDHLLVDRWAPDLELRAIPVTEPVDPVRVLVDEADVARWHAEGLPADRTSVENGAIIASCDRWPLLIDPQLQGLRWLRGSTIVQGSPGQVTHGGVNGASHPSASGSGPGGNDDHPHHGQLADIPEVGGSGAGADDENGSVAVDTPPGSNGPSRHATPDTEGPNSRAPSSLAPQRGGGRQPRHLMRRRGSHAGQGGHTGGLRRDLTVISSASADLISVLERCITLGLPVLVQLTGDGDASGDGGNGGDGGAGPLIPPALMPILSRRTYTRGRTTYISLCGRECEYHPSFRLFLHSRRATVHFPPEVAAQATVVDMRVAPLGLEEQLLTAVVDVQRPRLERARAELLQRMGGYTARLKSLEDRLLVVLARAEGDVLQDASLVESLERTKEAAQGVHDAIEASQQARAKMERAREGYRAVATRGSLLYFLLEELSALHGVYRYSLASFVDVFLGTRAGTSDADEAVGGRRVMGAGEAALLAGEDGRKGGMPRSSSSSSLAPSSSSQQQQQQQHNAGTGKDDDGNGSDPTGKSGGGGGGGGDDDGTSEVSAAEVHELVRNATLRVFRYVSAGLLEEHRLIFAFRLVLRVLDAEGELDGEGLEFLIRGATEAADENPCSDWLSMEAWNCVMALSSIRAFAELPSDMEKQPARFREWCELERPETERLPLEWKNISSFGRLLVIRCLRPDRLGAAISNFVRDKLGREFSAVFASGSGDLDTQISASAGPAQPVLFLLKRGGGADPLARVEQLATHLGLVETHRWRHVAMGGGKEAIATAAVEQAAADGGWVFLQNAELAPRWLARLEALLLRLAPSAQRGMRVFLSVSIENAGEGGGAGTGLLPDGLVRRSMKITQAAPDGLRANLHAAFDTFSEDYVAASSKPTELRSVLFALSFLHSVFVERKRYGPQGWSVPYAFSPGDLADAGDIASVYVDSRRSVPWRDIQHLVADVVYGGHVTDEWDRRLARTFVETTLTDEVLDGAELAPDLTVPNALAHDRYHAFIDANVTVEGPAMVSLNANAEMAHRLRTSTELLDAITRMRPAGGAGGAGGGQRRANNHSGGGGNTGTDRRGGGSNAAGTGDALSTTATPVGGASSGMGTPLAGARSHAVNTGIGGGGGGVYSPVIGGGGGGVGMGVAAAAEAAGASARGTFERARDAIDDIMERLPLNFDLAELEARGEDKVIIPAITAARASTNMTGTAGAGGHGASGGVGPNRTMSGASSSVDALADELGNMVEYDSDGNPIGPVHGSKARQLPPNSSDEDEDGDLDNVYPNTAHAGSAAGGGGGGGVGAGSNLNESEEPTEARDPFFSVFFNECARMNALLTAVRVSLEQADAALRGQAGFDEATSRVVDDLDHDRVPARWSLVSYPSELPLGAWFEDLVRRAQQLQEWTVDLRVPGSVCVAHLFNPPALLTALRQRHALLAGVELEKLSIVTEATRRTAAECAEQPDDASSLHIHGMYLEGATFDTSSGQLAPARFKEQVSELPVIVVRAVQRVLPMSDAYECPVYVTQARGASFVFAIQLPTGTQPPARWIKEGVACILTPNVQAGGMVAERD